MQRCHDRPQVLSNHCQQIRLAGIYYRRTRVRFYCIGRVFLHQEGVLRHSEHRVGGAGGAHKIIFRDAVLVALPYPCDYATMLYSAVVVGALTRDHL